MSPVTTAAQLVQRLFDERFCEGTEARSAEYHEGFRALLLQRIIAKPLACRHKAGSASFDAFFAGVDDGRASWAKHQRDTAAAA